MKRILTVIIALGLLAMASGCGDEKPSSDPKNWSITLHKEGKEPYGTFLAYQSLKYYFPGIKIEPLSGSFRFNNISDKMKYGDGGHSLLVLEGLTFHLSDYEWTQLKQFVDNGNEVVVFASTFDNRIEEELKCHKMSGSEEYYMYSSDTSELNNRRLLCLAKDTNRKFGYTGKSLRGYFEVTEVKEHKKKTQTSEDSSDSTASGTDNSNESSNDDSYTGYLAHNAPDTLGYVNSQPDFIRYQVGEGHITMHAAPLVLSNYFLLQERNVDYLTAIWRSLPRDINRIYWCDYYKRSVDVSSWAILWSFPATRNALLLSLALLLIYILFEGKRKQRVIPIIPPLKNESVSFVETVGRLYYNKGNHGNLAEKMSQQFLEWVRTHYFLNTNVLDEQFARQLTIKSGLPEKIVVDLTGMISEIRHGDVTPNDAYLYHLYQTIQLFYKNHRS